MAQFGTENQTLRQVLANGATYEVPPFQRDYAWSEEQWDDLWLDLQVLETDEGDHYMGYLVLQTRDNRHYRVIDGQQRLTTMSLLVLAALRRLQDLIDAGIEADDNQQRLDAIRSTYIGHFDPVTLVTSPKLRLNRHNHPIYRDHIVELQAGPRRGVPASSRLLGRALEWFVQRFRSQFPTAAVGVGAEVTKFVTNTLADRVFFTVITVPDELRAYRVFETLNARGVQLSASDLLKNYLFSQVDDPDQNPQRLLDLEHRWEHLIQRLGASQIERFLLVHWNSRHDKVRQRDLFKRIRTEVQGVRAAFDLIRAMDDDVETWLALVEPESSELTGETAYYAQLLKSFAVRQPYPLLLAAGRRDEKTFAKLLRAVTIIAVRYNVICRLPPQDQERVYAQTAVALHRGTLDPRGAVRSLGTIYPEDQVFQKSFETKRLATGNARGRRVVKYLLAALDEDSLHPTTDPTSPACTIEHLFPQNPRQGWDAFSDQASQELVDRLGNLVLLEPNLNRQAENLEWEQKRELLQQSLHAATVQLAASHPDWTPADVKRRQRTLAARAPQLWRLDL